MCFDQITTERSAFLLSTTDFVITVPLGCYFMDYFPRFLCSKQSLQHIRFHQMLCSNCFIINSDPGMRSRFEFHRKS